MWRIGGLAQTIAAVAVFRGEGLCDRRERWRWRRQKIDSISTQSKLKVRPLRADRLINAIAFVAILLVSSNLDTDLIALVGGGHFENIKGRLISNRPCELMEEVVNF